MFSCRGKTSSKEQPEPAANSDAQSTGTDLKVSNKVISGTFHQGMRGIGTPTSDNEVRGDVDFTSHSFITNS